MSISNVARIKTIATQLSANDPFIKTIYENTNLTIGDELIENHKIISFNCFIKNLKAYASIKSLDEVSLPNFNLDDSATDKLYKTLDVEWKSPRKQIALYIANQSDTTPSGENWYKVGSLSLLNPSGYPYRVYNLMDLFTDALAIELGDNGKIGIKIEDVGYGLLDSTDAVTIHGSYSEEVFVEVPETIYVLPPTGGSGTNPDPAPVVTQFPRPTLFRINASDITLNSDELVSNWSQSSNFTTTQIDATYQPTYKSNVINGKSAVYFDGVDKFLNIEQTDSQTGLTIVPSMGNWLIFMVAKFDDTATTIFSSSNGNESLRPSISLTGNRSVIGFLNPYGGAEQSTTIYEELAANYALDSNWKIHMIRRQDSVLSVYVDGNTYSLGELYSPISPTNSYLENLIIGCKYDNSSYFSGYLAEFGIVGDHDNNDINAIGNYFKTMYGVTWNEVSPEVGD